MFGRSIDSKGKYYIDSETEVVDLADSIFDPNKAMTQVCSIYKVIKEYEMRPDLISIALYGTTDYAEMIMKYSLVNNPFAIERNDLIYSAALSNIYNPVKETEFDNNGVFDAVKNYHKYIDKSKVPDSNGSDKVTAKIPGTSEQVNSSIEANISKTGDTGITVKDGKIYFGDIDESIQSVDSSIVDCATSGVSLGEFLNSAIRNSK
jgi:hypothetical protein